MREDRLLPGTPRRNRSAARSDGQAVHARRICSPPSDRPPSPPELVGFLSCCQRLPWSWNGMQDARLHGGYYPWKKKFGFDRVVCGASLPSPGGATCHSSTGSWLLITLLRSSPVQDEVDVHVFDQAWLLQNTLVQEYSSGFPPTLPPLLFPMKIVVKR